MHEYVSFFFSFIYYFLCKREKKVNCVSISFQKICYLPLNPMKEEGVETEKVAYTLPDGNTIEVCMS